METSYLFFPPYLVLMLCCNVSSPRHRPERSPPLPLVWPRLSSPNPDIPLKGSARLFFPKRMLSVPSFWTGSTLSGCLWPHPAWKGGGSLVTTFDLGRPHLDL